MEITQTFKRGVLGGYLSLLVFLSLNPWIRPESEGPGDKIDHAIAYGGLVILIFLSGKKRRAWYADRSLSAWAIPAAASLFIGAALEIAQSVFTYNRTGSVDDMVANTMGVLVGYAVFVLVGLVYSGRNR